MAHTHNEDDGDGGVRGVGRGRRYDTGATLAVSVGGLTAGWNDGVFAGDPTLVNWAKTQSVLATPVRLFDVDLVCGDDTPAGALAALGSWRPGRIVVHKAPAEITDMIEAGLGLRPPTRWATGRHTDV